MYPISSNLMPDMQSAGKNVPINVTGPVFLGFSYLGSKSKYNISNRINKGKLKIHPLRPSLYEDILIHTLKEGVVLPPSATFSLPK